MRLAACIDPDFSGDITETKPAAVFAQRLQPCAVDELIKALSARCASLCGRVHGGLDLRLRNKKIEIYARFSGSLRDGRFDGVARVYGFRRTRRVFPAAFQFVSRAFIGARRRFERDPDPARGVRYGRWLAHCSSARSGNAAERRRFQNPRSKKRANSSSFGRGEPQCNFGPIRLRARKCNALGSGLPVLRCALQHWQQAGCELGG